MIAQGPKSTIQLRPRWLSATLFLIALCNSAPAEVCNQLAAGTSFWVRLTAPVSSYTAKPGMPVQAFLLKSPECDNAAVFSAKVPVEGRILSVHRVGLGLLHETATLEMAFFRILPPGHTAIGVNGRVKLIDNARESVRNGVIRGIRSTDTPQGRISSRLKYLPSLHLYPDPFLLGYKMFFPIFPEPEIFLKPGTDMLVELARPTKLPDDLPRVSPIPALEQNAELNRSLTGLPERTLTKKGKEADVVDLVFSGSQADVEGAFQVAGWKQSESVSSRTVFRQFYSFLAKTSYTTAPMSAQFMEGRKPDLALEKARQSQEKRNHLRIWELDNRWEGMPLWASAAVRETGATLSIRHKGFIHHVSEDLGDEQQTVVRDLFVAGCVDSVGSIARPDMDHVMRNANGELFRTDGSLQLVRLKHCASDSNSTVFSDEPPTKPGSWAFRFLRRQILTVRSDLLRANCIYALFDLTQITIGAVRRHHAADAAIRQGSTLVSTSGLQAIPFEDAAVQPTGTRLTPGTSETFSSALQPENSAAFLESRRLSDHGLVAGFDDLKF